MSERIVRWMWLAGWPVRAVLLLAIRSYRVLLGPVLGGACRFYPSCSAYAEQAVAELGVVRGVMLSVWRVLRCSPLTAGGVDYPPRRRVHMYDAAIQQRPRAAPWGVGREGRQRVETGS